MCVCVCVCECVHARTCVCICECVCVCVNHTLSCSERNYVLTYNFFFKLNIFQKIQHLTQLVRAAEYTH